MATIGISLSRLKSHIETLSSYGRNPGGRGITRSCWSPPHEEARKWLLGRMTEAGLETRVDAAGNTFGSLRGEGAAVLTGSHIDTVPEGGPLDGALGVLAGLECLQTIKAAGLDTRRPLAVVAWSDEEGRYRSLFGSRAVTRKRGNGHGPEPPAVEGNQRPELMDRGGDGAKQVAG